MSYHAILFMCNDVHRAEWVVRNFRKHNPAIGLSIYNGGVDDRETRERVGLADSYEAGVNLWHRNTRLPVGSFGYGWFEKFYAIAEDRDADHTIYLETDVQTNRQITVDPKWDLSGPLMDPGPESRWLAYDFWGSYLRGGEFEENVNPTPNKYHTGMGGTVFRRNFFVRTRPNLHLVKRAFEMIPYVFYADLMTTLLGRHCGCTFGDWSEVSDMNGTYRYDEIQNRIYLDKYDPDATLIHSVKI